MGRLLDIDEVIRIAKDTFPKEDVRKIAWVLCHTPTAYDVEKVVAELVEMRNKDSQGCKDVGNKCLSYTDCGLCIMDRAIDIVKRGGAE